MEFLTIKFHFCCLSLLSHPWSPKGGEKQIQAFPNVNKQHCLHTPYPPLKSVLTFPIRVCRVEFQCTTATKIGYILLI